MDKSRQKVQEQWHKELQEHHDAVHRILSDKYWRSRTAAQQMLDIAMYGDESRPPENHTVAAGRATVEGIGVVSGVSSGEVFKVKKIEILPGTKICDFFRRVLPETVIENYIETHFADLHHLYAKAIAEGNLREARNLKIHYYSRFAWVLVTAITSMVRQVYKGS